MKITTKQSDENNVVNNEIKILEKTQNLPDVIINVIYLFIPHNITVFLNRTLYITNHHILRKYIIGGNMENYIRDVLRRDNEFVFSQLLNENYFIWISRIKNYRYKNNIYNNYFNFIRDFCLMNESNKCRNVINEFLEKHDLSKNQYKKKIIRNIRWTH